MSALSVRLKASLIHLGLSLLVAAGAAALVFGVWYPYPFRELSGGRELFTLLVAVDVVIGPVITLAVFNPSKSRRELRIDLGVVGMLQLVALLYGLWTVAVARPVHLVFDIDRFRAVHAIDVPEELLARTPEGIQALPWSGPTLLSVRPFRNAAEQADASLSALQGVHTGFRPDLWEPYMQGASRVRAAAQPVSELLVRKPQDAPRIEAALAQLGRAAFSTTYLPLQSRRAFWTVLVDPRTAEPLAYVPVDPF